MVPASNALWSASSCRDLLGSIVDSPTAARFDDLVVVSMCPEPAARAALLLLEATVAAPLVDGFLDHRTSVTSISVGRTFSPGRVVGPISADGDGARVVNDRYRSEHPALMASSIAHDLLWNVSGAGQFEEATLHMVVALVHLQLVSILPGVAHTGTELARRQNSLAISLLNSREPGESTLRVIARNGRGTIPGGAPNMQSADFWSIPFVGGEPCTSPAPELLWPVLQRVVGEELDFEPKKNYDQRLGEQLSACGVGGALDPAQQLRVMVALGLLDERAIASATGIGLGEVPSFFGLDDVFGFFN